MKVLLVASAASERTSIRRAIAVADHRFEVREAASCAEAQATLGEEEPDCIITDHQLPDGVGLDLLQVAHRSAFIVLTANADHVAARRALKAGAEDVLQKGELSPGTLLRSLRYAIERKKASELRLQLLHADRLSAIGQLAAGVAHEINNPATFITANQEILAEDAARCTSLIHGLAEHIAGEPDPARRRALEALLEANQADQLVSDFPSLLEENMAGMRRIVTIVKKLQTFSRIRQAATEDVDVNAVVEAVGHMLEHEIRHRARLLKDLAVERPIVMGERGEIHQVLTNLLVNAAHAIAEGSASENYIKVSTRQVGGLVKLTIEDSGCGIPKAMLGRIFDPFFTTKPPDKGTGLGLAICSEIVRKHRGRIEVRSEVGKGTCVEVTLPTEHELTGDLFCFVPRSAEPPSDPSPSGEEPPLKILAVDDEAMILSAYRRMLRGHQVIVASGGQEALSLLASDPTFDGILCDLMMPDLDGCTFHERLQSLAPHLLPKVVFCTGGAFTPRMRDFISRLRSPVLEKPISSEAIRETVRRWREA